MKHSTSVTPPTGGPVRLCLARAAKRAGSVQFRHKSLVESRVSNFGCVLLYCCCCAAAVLPLCCCCAAAVLPRCCYCECTATATATVQHHLPPPTLQLPLCSTIAGVLVPDCSFSEQLVSLGPECPAGLRTGALLRRSFAYPDSTASVALARAAAPPRDPGAMRAG